MNLTDDIVFANASLELISCSKLGTKGRKAAVVCCCPSNGGNTCLVVSNALFCEPFDERPFMTVGVGFVTLKTCGDLNCVLDRLLLLFENCP